jgi:hypothetical protein
MVEHLLSSCVFRDGALPNRPLGLIWLWLWLLFTVHEGTGESFLYCIEEPVKNKNNDFTDF